MGARPTSADATGRALYRLIATSDGITAREAARELGLDKASVNRRLYADPLVSDLCYADDNHRWHALIRQERPHVGLAEFCGWYSSVAEFMACDEDAFMDALRSGCARVGRNLNDTRGLIHSFTDCRLTMRDAFSDLKDFGVDTSEWEVAFELRIRRARWVRIYADVVVVTPAHAFSLEFKMKDVIEETEVVQAAKYVPFLELVFGRDIDVVCALVLTRARDLFRREALPDGSGEVLVASGDSLFNVFDEYLGFLS